MSRNKKRGRKKGVLLGNKLEPYSVEIMSRYNQFWRRQDILQWLDADKNITASLSTLSRLIAQNKQTN